MQTKGNILLILLVMMLFASAAILQLGEDNYLAHLISQHVEDLSSARKALNEGFKKLSMSTISQACYSNIPSCQISVSGESVNYALRQYQQKGQKTAYLQYTLKVKAGATSVKLRVMLDQASGKVVSWTYL